MGRRSKNQRTCECGRPIIVRDSWGRWGGAPRDHELCGRCYSTAFDRVRTKGVGVTSMREARNIMLPGCVQPGFVFDLVETTDGLTIVGCKKGHEYRTVNRKIPRADIENGPDAYGPLFKTAIAEMKTALGGGA